MLFFLGSDCYELFKTMQTCMQNYPTLYNKDLADDDEISSIDKVSTETKTVSEANKSDGAVSNK